MMAGICRAYNTANLRVVDHAGRKVRRARAGIFAAVSFPCQSLMFISL